MSTRTKRITPRYQTPALPEKIQGHLDRQEDIIKAISTRWYRMQHRKLDTLLAAYMAEVGGIEKRPSNITAKELLDWLVKKAEKE